MKKIFIIAAVLAVMAALCGCNYGMKMSYIYENGEKYVAGDREISDEIDTINVDYISGDVKIKASDNGLFTIKETSKKELDEARKVHTWVDGGTLYVRYCKSAKGLELNMLDKELTIGIPEGTKLSDVVVKVSSGNTDISCEADDIDLHAASGHIDLKQVGNSSNINIHASSGKVNAEIENADNMEIAVSSGKIFLTAGSIKDFKSSTASGKSEYTFKQVPENSEISAASGDITIYIPENSDLTAKLSAVSGDISTEPAFSKEGKTYVSGNGSNSMDVNVASGDIDIKNLD